MFSLTSQKLSNKKVFIFDLDGTLYLYEKDNSYTRYYHQLVKETLSFLKEKGIKIALASHNLEAPQILEKLQIRKYFDFILHRRNNICIPKNYMISTIQKIFSVSTEECIFFDDQPYILHELRYTGLDTVLVQRDKGIDFRSLLNAFE